MSKIPSMDGVSRVPNAAVAVFVGNEFDSLTGRGGDGEPLRKTPWGEIAFQLGLLAFLASDDFVSQWFQAYVKKAGIDVAKILEARKLSREIMEEITAAAPPGSARVCVCVWCGSLWTAQLVANAIV